MTTHASRENPATVNAYSKQGATVYDDPMNKNFLYGEITLRFLERVQLQPEEQVILDVGCGTGFIFDVMGEAIRTNGSRAIGVEPAQGMLDRAVEKYGADPIYAFHTGAFEAIPLPDQSVDRILSTLALHWVKSLDVAAQELRRVLKPGGRMDIFMIERDDGARFKRAIVAALRKHLTFEQIMTTAGLVQRVTAQQFADAFAPHFPGCRIEAENHRGVVHGTFDEHMKWWKARSTPVIAEVQDKEQFMEDLRVELERIAGPEGIPFDTSYLWITVE